MITCCLHDKIDPFKLVEFEAERTRCIRTLERTFLRPLDVSDVPGSVASAGAAASGEGLADVIDISDGAER